MTVGLLNLELVVGRGQVEQREEDTALDAVVHRRQRSDPPAILLGDRIEGAVVDGDTVTAVFLLDDGSSAAPGRRGVAGDLRLQPEVSLLVDYLGLDRVVLLLSARDRCDVLVNQGDGHFAAGKGRNDLGVDREQSLGLGPSDHFQ